MTVKRNVTKEEVMEELEHEGCGCVVRSVEITDAQSASKRNFTVSLSEEERDTLRESDLVLDVILEEGLFNARLEPKEQIINPVLQDTESSSHDNWALDHCAFRNGYKYVYSQTGRGVDIIFIDSGVDPEHSEFKKNGVSRVRMIEWETDQFSTKPAQYVDSGGHGTGVASCGVGETQGFARDSDIYSIKIFDADAYSPLKALQLARTWHEQKTNGRPTVVNNSWGYSDEYPVGHPKAGQKHPVQVSVIDAEIESMIDAGIIVVSAAGNENHHVAAEGSARYNESYYMDANGNYVGTAAEATYISYINRYTPGGSAETICVGSIGEFYPTSKFRRSWFSNFGSRVDIFVPGRVIQCASALSGNQLKKSNGTSFSSGILSGLIALWLELNKNANQEDVRKWLVRHAFENEVLGSLEEAQNLTARSLFNGLKFKQGKPHTVFLRQADQWLPVQHITSGQKAVYGRRL